MRLSDEVEALVDQFAVLGIERVPDAERTELIAGGPKFGTVFTDHLARISWTREGGWDNHRIAPYGPLSLDPATAVLHYGQEVFEGLKVYPRPDGTLWAFRPEENAIRMMRSAQRLALPPLPVTDFLAACAALVRVDRAWVPTAADSSLYLRPFMFASEAFLGVRPANAVEFLVIASPTGAYFAGGIKPVSIWVEPSYHRAGPGGTGAAKCGGNYAASLLPQELAAAHGFDQVCYLDARTQDTLEELGGMNLFLVTAGGQIRTPELTGSILDGITRASIIQLARDNGHQVAQEPIRLTDLVAGLADGSITEVFACGTAAVITPVGRLAGTIPSTGVSFDAVVGAGQPGTISMQLREQLTGIQYGTCADPHGWTTQLL